MIDFDEWVVVSQRSNEMLWQGWDGSSSGLRGGEREKNFRELSIYKLN